MISHVESKNHDTKKENRVIVSKGGEGATWEVVGERVQNTFLFMYFFILVYV